MHLKEGEETRGCRAPRPEYIEASAAVCSHQAKVLLAPWEALEKMSDSMKIQDLCFHGHPESEICDQTFFFSAEYFYDRRIDPPRNSRLLVSTQIRGDEFYKKASIEPREKRFVSCF